MISSYAEHRNQQRAQIKKIDTYIEIVGSSNRRLNAMADSTRLMIKKVLSERYAKVRITLVDDLAGLEGLVAKKPDLVVLGMKHVLLEPSKGYNNSLKVWLSDYLQDHGINFTGSTASASLQEFNKHLAKQKVIDAGLKSSKYFISTIDDPTLEHNLKFPLFVKPTNRGNSKGINDQSVVYSASELMAKVLSIHADCKSDALIEEYLSGREFSVAVVRQPGSSNLIAMPIEIVAPVNAQGNSFLSDAVKKADSEQVMVLNDAVLEKKLNALAIGVFEALGSRDYGRIDMRLDAYGIPSFIEANLMPGLSDHGYLSRCFNVNGQRAYQDMIMTIIELSLERTAIPKINMPQTGLLSKLLSENVLAQAT